MLYIWLVLTLNFINKTSIIFKGFVLFITSENSCKNIWIFICASPWKYRLYSLMSIYLYTFRSNIFVKKMFRLVDAQLGKIIETIVFSSGWQKCENWYFWSFFFKFKATRFAWKEDNECIVCTSVCSSLLVGLLADRVHERYKMIIGWIRLILGKSAFEHDQSASQTDR